MSTIALVTPHVDEIVYNVYNGYDDTSSMQICDNSCNHNSTSSCYDNEEIPFRFLTEASIANAPIFPSLNDDCSQNRSRRLKIHLRQKRQEESQTTPTCGFNYLMTHDDDDCSRSTSMILTCNEIMDNSILLCNRIPYMPTEVEMDDTIVKEPRKFLKPRNQPTRIYDMMI
jgi:hypothetical protein